MRRTSRFVDAFLYCVHPVAHGMVLVPKIYRATLRVRDDMVALGMVPVSQG